VPPVLNLSVKFDANIFFGDQYMAILLLCLFGRKMPFPAHFGEVFWRFVVGYCGDPKRHILSQKHAFWSIGCADQSRNATWVRADESKNKKKEKKL